MMNEKVLEQHNLFREKVRSEKSLLKAVKRKMSDEVFTEDDFGFDLEDLRFKKSYCQVKMIANEVYLRSKLTLS